MKDVEKEGALIMGGVGMVFAILSIVWLLISVALIPKSIWIIGFIAVPVCGCAYIGFRYHEFVIQVFEFMDDLVTNDDFGMR